MSPTTSPALLNPSLAFATMVAPCNSSALRSSLEVPWEAAILAIKESFKPFAKLKSQNHAVNGDFEASFTPTDVKTLTNLALAERSQARLASTRLPWASRAGRQ